MALIQIRTNTHHSISNKKTHPEKRRIYLYYMIKQMKKNWQLYAVMFLPLLIIILFRYTPMIGLQIAFKDFNATQGMWHSPWVGLKHFKNFVTSYQFSRLFSNTLGISVYALLAGFPIPVILAIMINECTHPKFKKSVQMITYAPYFISTVVMVSIVLMLLAPRSGMINNLISLLGHERIDFIANPRYFKSIYVWSGIWQTMGYNSIIYIAALSSIDQSLYEAATVDGTSKIKRIWYIDIPGILPTIIILLIMQCGHLMNVGHEKILLMQNSLNMPSSDIISTYVYRMGLENAQYSFSAAVGMFNSVINTILLITVNWIARKYSDTSLW